MGKNYIDSIIPEYWKVPKHFRKKFGGRNGCPALTPDKRIIGYAKFYPGKNGKTFEDAICSVVRLLN